MAKHKTIRELMAHNPTAPFCSGCGVQVPAIPKDVPAVVCGVCTLRNAELWKRGYWKGRMETIERVCPECGTAMPPSRQWGRCNRCKKRRLRERQRDYMRKARESATLS